MIALLVMFGIGVLAGAGLLVAGALLAVWFLAHTGTAAGDE